MQLADFVQMVTYQARCPRGEGTGIICNVSDVAKDHGKQPILVLLESSCPHSILADFNRINRDHFIWHTPHSLARRILSILGEVSSPTPIQVSLPLVRYLEEL